MLNMSHEEESSSSSYSYLDTEKHYTMIMCVVITKYAMKTKWNVLNNRKRYVYKVTPFTVISAQLYELGSNTSTVWSYIEYYMSYIYNIVMGLGVKKC